MAEERGGPGPVEDLLFMVGVVVVLVVLWFATGGPSRSDLRGIFLRPPAPLDTGGAYGPTIGNSSSSVQGPQ
jgi:hypothetical protein